MAVMFRRMVVAGVGLIGGSLALAARGQGLVEEVIGYGRGEKNLRLAQKRRIIDRYFLDEGAFPAGVDLLIMATPVRTTVPLTAAFMPKLEPGCLITDVGSVKAQLVQEMERILPRQFLFVGAHPVAGSEQWGAQAAFADLFIGQRCILTPTRNTDAGALKKVAALWRRVGARVEVMNPVLHDRILGMVSHLPHILAYEMVNALEERRAGAANVKDYCGKGFKDFTRIASSRPEIWRDICLANRDVLVKSLGDYIRRLERVRRWISDGKNGLLDREFARANEIRSRMA